MIIVNSFWLILLIISLPFLLLFEIIFNFVGDEIRIKSVLSRIAFILRWKLLEANEELV